MSSWRIARLALALSWLAPIMGHAADDTVRAPGGINLVGIALLGAAIVAVVVALLD
jgi:hypothetical protein